MSGQAGKLDANIVSRMRNMLSDIEQLGAAPMTVDTNLIRDAIAALAAPQPGGQGDARAQFEAWHCEKFKTRWQTGAPTRDMHNGVHAEKYGPAEQQVRWEAWQAAWQAALAARQPGAQERVAWASTGATGHKVVAMPGLHKLPYGDYDLYAAPPAQGIDLGQLSAQHVAALRDMRENMAAGTLSLNDWRGFGTAALDAVLALIDQRDAAPGVSNG